MPTNIKQHIVFIWVLISLCLNAQAEEIGLCDKLESVKKNSQQQLERFTLTQFGFDKDDRGLAISDLAIIVHNVNLPAQIKRVTFGRGQAQPACYFKPQAFAQGGEGLGYWGWHMLWQEGAENSPKQGLFYARMDGEAWVSSNPKTLTKLAPMNAQFKQDKQMITVTWQQTENGATTNMQAVSDDEGRSWEITPIQP